MTEPLASPMPPTGEDPDLPRGLVMRIEAWVLDHWPASVRQRLGILGIVLGLFFVAIPLTTRFVAGYVLNLDLLAYLGLVITCWIGAGGALVPVPGARPLSWLMIVNQGALLDPVAVAIVSALAMALGQSSYFLATRAGKRRVDEHGHPATHIHDAPPASRSRRAVARSKELLARGRERIQRRMADHPRQTIFMVAVIPSPLTTFATVTASATGIPFRRFITASLAGFLVLTTVLVLIGRGLFEAISIFS